MRLRLLLLLVLTLGITTAAHAQFGMVQGTVMDREFNIPIPNAAVLLLDADSTTVAATTTDARGDYRMFNVPFGSYTLLVRFLGYEEYRASVRVRATPANRDVRLGVKTEDLGEIEVTADGVADSSDVRASLLKLTPAQAKLVAGASEDVFRALQTLPGVVSASDYSNQLIVRGGGADQNLIVMDEVEIFNPYRMDGMSSLFNPALLRSIELYTGGFPSQYGDRLSAVLTTSLKEGGLDGFQGQTNVSLANVSLTLEGKTGVMNGGWILSGRRSYFHLVGEGMKERMGIYNDVAFPDFYDVQGKLVLRPTPTLRFQMNGLLVQDVLDQLVRRGSSLQGSQDRLDASDRTSTGALGAAFYWIPAAQFQAKLYANHYRNVGESDFSGDLLPHREPEIILDGPNGPEVVAGPVGETIKFAYDQQYEFRKNAVGVGAVYDAYNNLVEVGVGMDFFTNDLGLDLTVDEAGRATFEALRSAPNWIGAVVDSLDGRQVYRRYHAFAQDKITFGGRFFLQPGVRYDYNTLIGKGYVSPRMNASLDVGSGTTLRAAWGVYRQTPGYEKLLDDGSVFNLARFQSLATLDAERAEHYVVGLTQRFNEAYSARVEAYYKSFEDLIVQASALTTRNVPVLSTFSAPADPLSYVVREQQVYTLLPEGANDATGQSYGLEFLLEKRLTDANDRLTGWLSYTLALAEREQSILDVTTGQSERITIPFDYDRRHSVNAVFNFRFGPYLRWNLGGTWRYGTGFPYTPVLGYQALVGTSDDPNNPDEEINVILTNPTTGYVEFAPNFGGPRRVNSDRLPDYHRLDLRITYRTLLRGNALELYFDVINVYNRKNVLYYKYPIEIEEDLREDVPIVERKPPKPALFKEPVYMYPYLPSFGISYSF